MTTAPDYLTLQGDGDTVLPYRASAASMGGTDKENDAEAIPDPNDPDAREWNQIVGQTAALIQVSPVAAIHVTFSGGVPSVFAVYSGNPDLGTADVGCADTAAGVVTLTIPASLLPDARWGELHCQATGNFGGVAYRSAAQTLRCEIYDSDSGAASDTDFIAKWF
jgi:hypothetical protein